MMVTILCCVEHVPWLEWRDRMHPFLLMRVVVVDVQGWIVERVDVVKRVVDHDVLYLDV